MSTKLEGIINSKTWLAPLAGYTDRAFRQLCKKWGVDVLVSEMVSADGLVRSTQKTLKFMAFDPEERPYGIQLFGHDPLTMARATEICLSLSPDFIDVNMGCPVKKVVRRGAGSALMRDPERAARIVIEMKAAIAGQVPLTVKFRSGWDNQSLNYREFGMLMQDSGADALCLHPRTTKQMFSGLSNWEHIRMLKQAVQIPVIGNGDIVSPENAVKMYLETGCDSIMIGRGALGRPWIFSQIKQQNETGTYTPVDVRTVQAAMLEHARRAAEYNPEHVVVRELRSQLCHYSKGIVGGAEIRRRINHAASLQEIYDIIEPSQRFDVAADYSASHHSQSEQANPSSI